MVALALVIGLVVVGVVYAARAIRRRGALVRSSQRASFAPRREGRRPSASPDRHPSFGSMAAPSAPRREPIRIVRALQPLFVSEPGDRLVVDGLLSPPSSDPSAHHTPGLPATILLSTRTHPLVAAASTRLLHQWAEESQNVRMEIVADERGTRAKLGDPTSKIVLDVDDVVSGSRPID